MYKVFTIVLLVLGLFSGCSSKNDFNENYKRAIIELVKQNQEKIEVHKEIIDYQKTKSEGDYN